MTETLRYGLLGASDIRFGSGVFEVRLADGRVVTIPAVNLSHISGALHDGITFLQSGTGAVARTAASKLGRIVHVSDFTGTSLLDGTVDVTTAVQAAIDSLPSTGGEVVIDGLCGIGTAGLLVSGKSNLTIRVGGPLRSGFKLLGVSTRTLTNFGSTGIVVLNGTNVRVEGLLLDGNAIASNVIGFEGCTDSAITGCRVVNAALTAAVAGVNNTRHAYRHNTILDSTGSCRGLWAGHLATGGLDHEPLIEGNHIRNTAHTGLIAVCIGGRVLGNAVIDPGASGSGSGIIVSASSTGKTERTLIEGNVCRGAAFHGIQSDSATSSDFTDGIVCQGNLCEENDGSGIYVVRTRNWLVSGNLCRNNNLDAVSTGDGITVQESKRVVITGNYCYDTRAGGARTQTTGIICSANAAGGALGIEDVLLSGNVVYNNATWGLLVTHAAPGTANRIAVVGNVALDNGTRGIQVAEAVAGSMTNVLVAGNLSLGNSTQDLIVEADDATIGDNRYSTSTDLIFTFADADTTPSVKGRRLFKATNTNPTTITTFDDGVVGQEILVIFTDANTTIAESGNIRLSAAFTSSADDTMRLVYDGTNWYEVSRSVN